MIRSLLSKVTRVTVTAWKSPFLNAARWIFHENLNGKLGSISPGKHTVLPNDTRSCAHIAYVETPWNKTFLHSLDTYRFKNEKHVYIGQVRRQYINFYYGGRVIYGRTRRLTRTTDKATRTKCCGTDAVYTTWPQPISKINHTFIMACVVIYFIYVHE